MEYINDELIRQVAAELKISKDQINVVLGLLSEGNTVPFIARYRKELTGALDEEQIREISKKYEYGQALSKRKEAVIRLIDEKGLLTDELSKSIMNSQKLVDVEDLYLPFKEKKKTKATKAIALGLEPLAKKIMEFPVNSSFEELAEPFINDKVIYEEALEGAGYIISEIISDNASYRKFIRNECQKSGVVVCKKKKKADDEKHVYEMYYEYQEEVRKIRPHRILALNRAEGEKVISVAIEVNKDKILANLNSKIIKNINSFVCQFVKDCVADSYKRLMFPAIEREIRGEITEKAETKAIEVFSINLKKLLLQPPMKGNIVLGVDPAYRTGCKFAAVDETGKVLEKGVIYQNQKYIGEKIAPSRIKEAKDTIKRVITEHKVTLIAIGNGTASRETEDFVSNILKELDGKTHYAIVNEAGASVYSASDLAREEFPDYQVEERSAVSIARRLQDPLSELVKIDPKSIGVGQYQHDITKSRLNDSLDFVVSTAVNSVGVNVNTASKALLGYVSGVNKTIANNIIKYRSENGTFKNRNEIKKVPKLGAKSYEQAIGFLRIPEGEKELDVTSIHPESYKIARKIKELLNIDVIGSEDTKKIVEEANIDQLVIETKSDKYTVTDIVDAFAAPLRDPRDKLDKPLLRTDVLHIEDLKEGMKLEGVVRNVVDFGAFVDCGLHEDGLVHISKISKNYIKHPLDVLNVGDIISVWVLKVDLIKHKVALTMLQD